MACESPTTVQSAFQLELWRFEAPALFSKRSPHRKASSTSEQALKTDLQQTLQAHSKNMCTAKAMWRRASKIKNKKRTDLQKGRAFKQQLLRNSVRPRPKPLARHTFRPPFIDGRNVFCKKPLARARFRPSPKNVRPKVERSFSTSLWRELDFDLSYPLGCYNTHFDLLS